MSKLVYSDVASEIVYKDGRSIPVWYPMGPRSAPVYGKPNKWPNKNEVRRREAIAKSISDCLALYPGGATMGDLQQHISYSDEVLRYSLNSHPQLFRRDELPEIKYIAAPDGKRRRSYSYRYHLIDSVGN